MKKPLKIALWCLFVGLLLAFLGLDPLDFWVWMGEAGESAAAAGGSFLRWAGPYMAAGAAIVVPIVGGRWAYDRFKRRPMKSDTPPDATEGR